MSKAVAHRTAAWRHTVLCLFIVAACACSSGEPAPDSAPTKPVVRLDPAVLGMEPVEPGVYLWPDYVPQGLMLRTFRTRPGWMSAWNWRSSADPRSIHVMFFSEKPLIGSGEPIGEVGRLERQLVGQSGSFAVTWFEAGVFVQVTFVGLPVAEIERFIDNLTYLEPREWRERAAPFS
jgi:hypothetical protein